MNKVELLSELAAKFYKVGIVTDAEASVVGRELRAAEGVNWYLVGVYDKDGETLIRKNIPFYIEGEGTAEEQAFYADKVPAPKSAVVVASTFGAELAAFVATQAWITYDIVSTNDGKEYAFVKGYTAKDNVAIGKTYLVKRVGKAFQIYEYVGD